MAQVLFRKPVALPHHVFVTRPIVDILKGLYDLLACGPKDRLAARRGSHNIIVGKGSRQRYWGHRQHYRPLRKPFSDHLDGLRERGDSFGCTGIDEFGLVTKGKIVFDA